MPQHSIQGAQGPVPCLGNIKQNKIKTNLNSDSLVGAGFVDKENPNRPTTSMLCNLQRFSRKLSGHSLLHKTFKTKLMCVASNVIFLPSV